MLIDTDFNIDATPLATAILQGAGVLAFRLGEEVRSGHILDALLSTVRIEGVIGDLDLDENEGATDFLRGEWADMQVPERESNSRNDDLLEYAGTVHYGPLARRALELAKAEAPGLVDVEHIFMGLVLEPSSVASRFLRDRGVTYDAIKEELDRQEVDQLELALV